MLCESCESVKMLNPWRNAHSTYSETVPLDELRDFDNVVTSQQYSHCPQLCPQDVCGFRNTGRAGKNTECLIRPVRADQSEQALKRQALVYQHSDRA